MSKSNLSQKSVFDPKLNNRTEQTELNWQQQKVWVESNILSLLQGAFKGHLLQN